MPPLYRKPSHRPVKKSKPTIGDEEQSNCTHMSRKEEKQRCSICDSTGHNKSICPKPIEDEPKRPRGKPKGTTKPNCSAQHDPQPKKLANPISSAPPSSSAQPTIRTLSASQPTLATSSSQPVGHFSIRIFRAPHVSPKKLKLMAKLPLRRWGLL
ncbi:hypothetical protein Ahy_A06g025887 [Arachis hypogaea]|uniref:CCHC-type domain-containing protein n=1 Tax=Arachis hypogaea TaxID=3818 RepID=A0A445CIY1_ARAHY|nr:hypothetical protein Ahy_A06g025887 [Arachis hypogaea]